MSKSLGPDPNNPFPITDDKKLGILKNHIKASNILVGDYTYFDDRKNGPETFEENNVLYNYHLTRVKLEIGKFCAIAAESKFLMTGDHKLDGISTYPFPIFAKGWENVYDITNLPIKGDIIIGNDVWLGYDCLIKNGVTIGDGAIIAARAVVVKDVPAYSIVAGNPAKVVAMRFSDTDINRLLDIAWWNWDIDKINSHLPLICDADISALEDIAKTI